MAIVQNNWLEKIVHCYSYCLDYIYHHVSVCRHEEKNCLCTNFSEVISSHLDFSSSAQPFVCQKCNEGGKVIAYCNECRLFLDEHCVRYHKKIKLLLKHRIIQLKDHDTEQNFKCQFCVDGGNVTAFCRHCGLYIDEACVHYHSKIKTLIGHNIIDLRGKKIADIKLSALSPVKYCLNSQHKNELSLFCSDRGEFVCLECDDICQYNNLTTVQLYYELIDIINDSRLFLTELLLYIPKEESILKDVLTDLLVLIVLRPSVSLDASVYSPKVQQILSTKLESHFPDLAKKPYTKISCDLLKSTLKPLVRDLENVWTKYREIHEQSTQNADVDTARKHLTEELLVIQRPLMEGSGYPETEHYMDGAIGDTLGSLNSLELFGEGNKTGAEESTFSPCHQKNVDEQINELRKHVAYGAAGYNHDSFNDIHA